MTTNVVFLRFKQIFFHHKKGLIWLRVYLWFGLASNLLQCFAWVSLNLYSLLWLTLFCAFVLVLIYGLVWFVAVFNPKELFFFLYFIMIRLSLVYIYSYGLVWFRCPWYTRVDKQKEGEESISLINNFGHP